MAARKERLQAALMVLPTAGMTRQRETRRSHHAHATAATGALVDRTTIECMAMAAARIGLASL